MVVGVRDIHQTLHFSGEDLADLDQGLARNDQLLVSDFILQFHLPDGDPVSIQGDHPQHIVFDLKQLSRHHLVALAVRDGEDGLTDHFFQSKL